MLQQIQHNEENNVSNLNTLNNENMELTECNKKLLKEYEQLQNEHNVIENKYNDLINQLSLKNDEISQLESDKKEAMIQFTEINQKNLQNELQLSQTLAENEQLLLENEKLQKDKELIKDNYDKLKQENAKLNEHLNEIATENDKLNQELISASDKVMQLNLQDITKNPKYEMLLKENNELKNQLDLINIECTNTKNELNKKQQESDEYIETFQKMNELIDEKEEKIAKFTTFFNSLKSLNTESEDYSNNNNNNNNGRLLSEENALNVLDNLDDLLSSHREDNGEIDSLYVIISQCKEAIIALKNERDKNENILQENEDYRTTITELIQQNKELENKLISHRGNNIIQEEKDEDEIEMLREQNKHFIEMIQRKEKEIDHLKTKIIESQSINSQGNSTSGTRISALDIPDSEKIEKYKKRLEAYKVDLESERKQSLLLKDQIRELKNEIQKSKTFDNKIANYNEFTHLFKIAFDKYEPKKKEQKDAFKIIKEHLGVEEEMSPKKKK